MKEKIEPIEISDIADRVVETMRTRWIGLMVWSVALVYSTVAVSEVSGMLFRAGNLGAYAAAYLAGTIAMSAVSIAFLRFSFAAVDGKAMSFSEALSGASRVFVRYVGASALFTIGMFLGLFLLVIPGVVYMLVFGFAPILVVDEGRAPIEAFRRSAELTRGTRLRLLYLYSIAFAAAFVVLAPWSLAPGPVATGMTYAVFTLVFCAFSVLSASVTRALQERHTAASAKRLTTETVSV